MLCHSFADFVLSIYANPETARWASLSATFAYVYACVLMALLAATTLACRCCLTTIGRQCCTYSTLNYHVGNQQIGACDKALCGSAGRLNGTMSSKPTVTLTKSAISPTGKPHPATSIMLNLRAMKLSILVMCKIAAGDLDDENFMQVCAACMHFVNLFATQVPKHADSSRIASLNNFVR